MITVSQTNHEYNRAEVKPGFLIGEKGRGGKPQITRNDVIRNFQKRNFLWDKHFLKWKVRSRGLVLALNQDFAKGGGCKPKVK